MPILSMAQARLASFGYPELTTSDNANLKFLCAKCKQEVLDNINHKTLPTGLIHIVADMVVGQFLSEKKTAGQLDGVEGFDFSAPVASIKEGDVDIAFSSSSATGSEAQFDAMLDRLKNPPDSVFAAYRRFRW